MQPTILIVEDHEAVRGHLADWLRVSFPECRILDVASAEEALSLAATESLAVVIMDICLPRMDGLEATGHIKGRQPNARVLILSLYDDLAQRTRAGVVGASAFVSKQRMHADLLPTLDMLLPQRVRRSPQGETRA